MNPESTSTNVDAAVKEPQAPQTRSALLIAMLRENVQVNVVLDDASAPYIRAPDEAPPRIKLMPGATYKLHVTNGNADCKGLILVNSRTNLDDKQEHVYKIDAKRPDDSSSQVPQVELPMVFSGKRQSISIEFIPIKDTEFTEDEQFDDLMLHFDFVVMSLLPPAIPAVAQCTCHPKSSH
jgi:hypothetical protein